MRRAALLCLPVLLLTACGGDSTTPTAQACQSADPNSDLGQECLDIARQLAADAIASETPAEDVTGELDPSECQDPAYAEENAEFCYGGGYVDAEAAMTGPATEPAEFPGGVTARVVSVATEPADMQSYDSDDPTFDTLVTVTVEMTVSNGQTYPLESFGVLEDLMYGANLYTAQAWFTDGGSGDLPEQITPGTTVTTRSQHTMPSTELGELAFEFSPASQYEGVWTFTDLEDLLPS